MPTGVLELVHAKVTTLREIEEWYSLDDVADMLDFLHMRQDLEREQLEEQQRRANDARK